MTLLMWYSDKLLTPTSTPLFQNSARPPLDLLLSTVTKLGISSFHLNHSIHFPSCLVSERKRTSGASRFWISRSPQIARAFPNPRQFQVISLIFAREAASAAPHFHFSSFSNSQNPHYHPLFLDMTISLDSLAQGPKIFPWAYSSLNSCQTSLFWCWKESAYHL